MKKNIIYRYLLIAFSAFMLSTAAFAEDKEKAPAAKAEAATETKTETAEVDPDIAEGKALFDEANCLKCHDTKVFTREDRKVTDLEGLGRQTRMCQQNLGIQWFDEDTDKVIAYLNHEFYKFPKAAEGDAKPAEGDGDTKKADEAPAKSPEGESKK